MNTRSEGRSITLLSTMAEEVFYEVFSEIPVVTLQRFESPDELLRLRVAARRRYLSLSEMSLAKLSINIEQIIKEYGEGVPSQPVKVQTLHKFLFTNVRPRNDKLILYHAYQWVVDRRYRDDTQVLHRLRRVAATFSDLYQRDTSVDYLAEARQREGLYMVAFERLPDGFLHLQLIPDTAVLAAHMFSFSESYNEGSFSTEIWDEKRVSGYFVPLDDHGIFVGREVFFNREFLGIVYDRTEPSGFNFVRISHHDVFLRPSRIERVNSFDKLPEKGASKEEIEYYIDSIRWLL